MYYDANFLQVHLTKQYLKLEPIGCVFILGFVSILAVQFICMLIHRFDTFTHVLANMRIKLLCCTKVMFLKYLIIFNNVLLFPSSKYIEYITRINRKNNRLFYKERIR